MAWLLLYVLPATLVPNDAVDPVGARGDARSALVQAAAGVVLLAGLVFTGRTLRLNRQGQLTERFAKAIEQLGDDKLDVRLGGIYSLERIARDSADDHWTIVEVLTAFVREHSADAKRPSRTWPGEGVATHEGQGTIRRWLDGPSLPTDLQAAMTVIGRRRRENEDGRQALNLMGTNLAGAHLEGAHLERAQLIAANLSRADLRGAHLGRAYLTVACLEGALLSEADLAEAHLEEVRASGARMEAACLRHVHVGEADFRGADLTNANLDGAHLVGTLLDEASLVGASLKAANLRSAHMKGTRLVAAYLDGADLRGASLERASLEGASLTGANLEDVSLHGSLLTGAILTNANLRNVRADSATAWPAGYDPESSGVLLED